MLKPNSKGSTTACAARNSSAVLAVRIASRAIANWSFPPAILAMIFPAVDHDYIITVFNANWNYMSGQNILLDGGAYPGTF
jgi:hypothetical protein